MALGWVDIFATNIRSMLNLLPFASASCACLLRAPKRRPPVEVRDVRKLRDFAYRLVHPGGRCLCAGLGLGGVLVFSWGGATTACALRCCWIEFAVTEQKQRKAP